MQIFTMRGKDFGSNVRGYFCRTIAYRKTQEKYGIERASQTMTTIYQFTISFHVQFTIVRGCRYVYLQALWKLHFQTAQQELYPRSLQRRQIRNFGSSYL